VILVMRLTVMVMASVRRRAALRARTTRVRRAAMASATAPRTATRALPIAACALIVLRPLSVRVVARVMGCRLGIILLRGLLVVVCIMGVISL
jgi:hypothetical protein